jgi:hypothetical protein
MNKYIYINIYTYIYIYIYKYIGTGNIRGSFIIHTLDRDDSLNLTEAKKEEGGDFNDTLLRYKYVCIYTYMYIHIYVCLYGYVYTCIYLCLHMYTYLFLYIYI